jgi:hypothetical protein
MKCYFSLPVQNIWRKYKSKWHKLKTPVILALKNIKLILFYLVESDLNKNNTKLKKIILMYDNYFCFIEGPSWSWLYGSWIYNYLCNQCYRHWSCTFESCSGEVYSIQHYVIKFVSDLRRVSCFLRVLQFPPPIKLTATI